MLLLQTQPCCCCWRTAAADGTELPVIVFASAAGTSSHCDSTSEMLVRMEARGRDQRVTSSWTDRNSVNNQSVNSIISPLSSFILILWCC